jgi:hypothetical protein
MGLVNKVDYFNIYYTRYKGVGNLYIFIKENIVRATITRVIKSINIVDLLGNSNKRDNIKLDLIVETGINGIKL